MKQRERRTQLGRNAIGSIFTGKYYAAIGKNKILGTLAWTTIVTGRDMNQSWTKYNKDDIISIKMYKFRTNTDKNSQTPGR